MNDTVNRYKSLVDSLHSLTSEKKIQWDKKNFDGELRCQLAKYYIVLDESQNAEGIYYVSVSVKGLSGDEIDHFTDQDLVNVQPANKLFTSYWKLLSDLLHQASRQASGADDALDEIIGDLLDKELPF